MTLWLEPLKLIHHPSKIGSHRYCGSRDIMVLVCHLIFKDPYRLRINVVKETEIKLLLILFLLK